MAEVETEDAGTKWHYWHQRLKAEYVARLAAWSDIREQMPLLYDAACWYDRPVIAELGTRTGQSTAALLAGVSMTGGHVWSVDNGPVTVPSWWAETGLWSFLAADDMGDEAAVFIPEELDVLFIDTSHLYDHTLAELRWYVPRVRPGGTVLCHDAELTRDGHPLQPGFPDGAALMGDDWIRAAAAGPEYPVAAALDTYCAEADLTWESQDRPVSAPGMPFYGLGTILIPPCEHSVVPPGAIGTYAVGRCVRCGGFPYGSKISGAP